MGVVVDFSGENDRAMTAMGDFSLRPGGVPGAEVADKVGDDIQGHSASADSAASHADGSIGQSGEGAAMDEAGKIRMHITRDGHVELRPAAAHFVDEDAAVLDELIAAEDILNDSEAFFWYQGISASSQMFWNFSSAPAINMVATA